MKWNFYYYLLKNEGNLQNFKIWMAFIVHCLRKSICTVWRLLNVLECCASETIREKTFFPQMKYFQLDSNAKESEEGMGGEWWEGGGGRRAVSAERSEKLITDHWSTSRMFIFYKQNISLTLLHLHVSIHKVHHCSASIQTCWQHRYKMRNIFLLCVGVSGR